MRVICEKRINEDLFYKGRPVSSMWTEWQVLKCPLCEEINVLKSYSYADDDSNPVVENGHLVSDETGLTLYNEAIHTTALYPLAEPNIPQPHFNMPIGIQEDYKEAKQVYPLSARSAAALLRLAIQKLCVHLGEKGKDINSDIASMVRKGLPIHIQQALDIVRVIGNEAVHPGLIDVRDNPEIARRLFGFVNEIVDNRIGKSEKQDQIEEMYASLPKQKLEQIKKRDKGVP